MNINLSSFNFSIDLPNKPKCTIYATDPLKSFILNDNYLLSQITNIYSLPGINQEIVGLPDIHAGLVFPVGICVPFDVNLNPSIIPEAIGYDINCGVRCYKLNIDFDEWNNSFDKKWSSNNLVDINEINSIVNSEDIKTQSNKNNRRSKDFITSNNLLENNIFNIENTNKYNLKDINEMLNHGLEFLVKNKIISDNNLKFSESNGKFNGNVKLISQKSKARGLNQLGTIGTGNHYIEIQYIDKIVNKEICDALGLKDKQIILSVHSGSRGLGFNVCQEILESFRYEVDTNCTGGYFNIVNKWNLNNNFEKFDIHKDKKNKGIKKEVTEKKEILSGDKINDSIFNLNENQRNLIENDKNLYKKIKKDLFIDKNNLNYDKKNINFKTPWLKYDDFLSQKYLSVINTASNYALCNRAILGENILLELKKIFPKLEYSLINDTSHNNIKLEDENMLVVRKGASRILEPYNIDLPWEYRHIGQPVMVGGSMGTYSYILVGNDCKKTYRSTCHGSGRLVPRSKCHEIFTYEDTLSKMRDIHLQCNNKKGVIEEGPDCYKDVNEVVKSSEKNGITNTVCRVKPLYVIKDV